MRRQIEAVRAFNRFYTDFLGLLNQDLYGAPVTLGEARVLLEIGRAPGIQARDLMGLLSMDRGHLSRTLGRLERRGLIARRRREADRRSLGISLTAAGNELLAELERLSSDQIRGILKGLSPARRRELLGAMAAIQGMLKE
jgi:DNA-binding MarR family transcriptional regulator